MPASSKEQVKWAKGLIANNSAITVGASQNGILPAFSG